jgi:SpoVK/Ycf46/Vps4 family AAA+-type ATPase
MARLLIKSLTYGSTFIYTFYRVQMFREARRQLPAVLYIPKLDIWWNLVPQTVQALLVSRLAGLEPFTPLLLLATSNSPFDELPEEVHP